jgi:hypothetical protein
VIDAKLVPAAMSFEVEMLAAPEGKTKSSPVVGTAFEFQLAAVFHKLLALPFQVQVAASAVRVRESKKNNSLRYLSDFIIRN